MAMNAFELFGILKLDKSDFEKGMSEVETKSSGFGKGLAAAAKVGLTAVAGAATAVVGFGASAVATGSRFDQAMGGVAATLGKDMNQMAEETGKATVTVNGQIQEFEGTLRDFAQFMGKNTVFSATQAAEALNYMALAGYDTQKSMSMLPSVLDMAAAGSMDLAKASDMITDTQSALGLDFERTGQMVNEFAKAASTGNTSVEQLGEAFLRVGGLASELNGGLVYLEDGTTKTTDGVQELEIALTAMANAGVKGAEAGTHMRNMLLKLSSPTDAGAKALENMGVSVFDAQGKMRALSDIFGDLNGELSQMTQADRIQIISDLFNTRDLASAEALLAAMNSDWDEIGDSILNAGSAASEMAATKLDNLAGDMTLFNSALESAQIAINDQLSPTLRDFVQFGTQGIQDFTNALGEGGLSAAMESLGGILAQGLQMVVNILPDVVKAGTQLLEALLKGIIQAAPQIGATALQLVQMLWEGITKGLPQLTDAAIEIMGQLSKGIKDNLPQMIESGLNAIMEFSGSLRENVGEIIDAGIELILSLAQGLIDGLPAMVKTIPTIVSNMAGIINDNAPKILAAGVQLILMLIQGIVKTVPTLIKEFPKIVKAIWDVITAVQWLNLGKTIIEGIGKGVMMLAKKIPDALKNIGQTAVNFMKSIEWTNLGRSILEHILAGIMALVTKVPQALKTIGTNAVSAMKGIDWKGLGLNIILGIANGIANSASRLIEAAKDAAKAAFDAAKDFLGIESPSKKFRYIGEMVGEGMAGGIEDTMSDVEKAIAGYDDLYPSDMVANAGTTTSNNANITLNVYGAQGQDVNALAEIVSRKLGQASRRTEVVWA